MLMAAASPTRDSELLTTAATTSATTNTKKNKDTAMSRCSFVPRLSSMDGGIYV